MAIYSLASIDKLEKQLQERYMKLVAVMHGLEVTKDEMKILHYTHPHRRVNDDDIRVAVEDFSIILKEIKASLGKRHTR